MKKTIIGIAFAFILIFSIPVPLAHAETAPTASETWKWLLPKQHGAAVSGTAMNQESSGSYWMQSQFYSLSCLIMGGPQCTDKDENVEEFICGSAVMKINSVIAQTFTQKPADVGLWVADTGKTLGFIPKTVYAQGVGFAGLEPLLPIWKAFRNIAYLLMAVVMVALGFMIMFRKKIDPHTVVTAQNAIPRVVIALILITFSYAIVGLMIDLMYVIIYFTIALFKSTGLLDNPAYPVCKQYATPEQLYGNGNLWANLWRGSEWNPYKILFGWNADPQLITGALSAGGVVALLLSLAPGVGPLIGGVGGGILLFLPLLHGILAIAMLYLFLRLLFFFLGSYIQIIISLLLAPLQLLFEAVPGSTSFSSWIKNLVANLAVFPIGAAMFMLSNVFTHFSNMGDGGKIWAPPYATIMGYTAGQTQIASLVSVGILFAIPQVAGSIKESLKAKPAMPMFDMGGAGGSVMNMLSMFYYLKMLSPKSPMEKKEGANHGEHG